MKQLNSQTFPSPMLSENIRRCFPMFYVRSLFRNNVFVEHFFPFHSRKFTIFYDPREYQIFFATKKISINGVCRSKTQIYLGDAWPVRGFDDRKIAFVKIQRTRSLMNGT